VDQFVGPRRVKRWLNEWHHLGMTKFRAPRLAELELLRDIERDAGRAFAEVGMPEIANDEPLSVAKLERFASVGHAWVATRAQDVPVAYLLSAVVDGCVHVEQVSVARSASSRGIGALLIDHLSAAAAQDGREWVTLTTFRDVPWNAPYYQRLGFKIISAGDQGRQLAELVARSGLGSGRLSSCRDATQNSTLSRPADEGRQGRQGRR